MDDPIRQNVPIVGQPFQVLKWSPLALILCKCQLEAGTMNLIQIFGFENTTCCPKCGLGFTLKGLMPDGQMVVQTVRPTPKGSVM